MSAPPATDRPSNFDIANRLDAVADLLVARGAAERRCNLYRRGARTLRLLSRPVLDILRDAGLDGLIRVPGIGEKLARAVRRVAATGELPILQRLRPRERAATTTGYRAGVLQL